MNFYADWVLFLRSELKRNGLKETSTFTDLEIEIAYFNLEFRLIERKPRRCFVSREMSLEKKYEKRFKRILRTAETGGDLNIYLSKTLLDPQYNDMLLNHWGIHHLHLGKPTASRPGFASRTPELLYARVSEDAIYFIQITDHMGFAEQELLEIIYRNWPALIDAELPLLPAPEMPTAAETAQLRKAGIVTAIRLSNGKLYLPYKGGFTTSGTSVKVMDRISQIRRWIRALQQSTYAYLAPHRRLDPVASDFHLSVEARGYFAVNSKTSVRIMLADRDAPIG